MVFSIFRFIGLMFLFISNRFNFNSKISFCLASSSTPVPSSSSSSSTSTSTTPSASASTSTASASITTEVSPNDEMIEKEIPLLPHATSNPDEVRSLKLGESMKLDELGPIIITNDGHARRITNWDTLTPQEKESSFRVISARNKKRLEKLQQKQQQQQQQQLKDEDNSKDDHPTEKSEL